MKRLAVLLAALFLMLTLSIPAFAADAPVSDATAEATQSTESTASGGSLRSAAENGLQGAQDQRHDYEGEPAAPAPAAPTPTSAPTELNPIQQLASLPVVATPDSPAPDGESPVNRVVIIVVIISGAVLLILLAVIVVLMLRKRTPSDGETSAHPVGMRGLAMEIEVLSGLCYNDSLSFHIRRNLTIGTDAGCDLVFEDAEMQPMHAVISRSGEGVTIAECAEFGKTYVGGMKIFSTNRLRSGDVITIGSTSFRVTF